jgi:hypothetical protein
LDLSSAALHKPNGYAAEASRARTSREIGSPHGKLCHNVDEREDEGAQVLPRWVKLQVDSELALQLLEIDVEDLVAVRGADPWSAQLQLLESLDDRVKAGGGRRLGARALTSSPSVVTTKSRLLGTQLMP